MTEHEEDGFDPELATILSLVCHDQCDSCPHDIGITLAIAVKKYQEEVE